MSALGSTMPPRPVLARDYVSCWLVELERPDHVVDALSALLSPDERERAGRFVFARDRRRFIVTRACLRLLLARGAETRPQAIRFDYTPHGKPALAFPAPSPPIHFN